MLDLEMSCMHNTRTHTKYWMGGCGSLHMGVEHERLDSGRVSVRMTHEA